MVNCDTCNDEGRIRWMIEMDPNCYMEPDSEGMIPCPDCDGGFDARPTLLDWFLVDTRPGRWLRKVGWAIRDARLLWRDRNSTAIAAIVVAHQQVLDDEPRLRGLVDHELRRQIDDVRTPLGWRRVDLRWSLTNAWRAARGLDPLPLPYEVVTYIDVSREGSFFERGQQVAIRAERIRRAIVRR